MLETIVAKFTNVLRNAVRAAGVATRRTPWLVPSTRPARRACGCTPPIAPPSPGSASFRAVCD